MIQCPNCGEFQVLEERHIPLPTGQSTCLQRILRLWSITVIAVVIFGTLGIVALGFWISGKLPEDQRNGCGDGCIILVTGTLLFLFPFAIGRATSFLVSTLTWFHKRRSGPPDVLPRLYWRTCSSCDFEWTWKPGDPPGKVRPCPKTRRWGQHPLDKRHRRQLQQIKGQAYQPFLDELIAHWNGVYTPEPGFSLDAPDAALVFFQSYQCALGEDPTLQPGHRPSGFIRNYLLSREEILSFMRAYQHLRRGERAVAAEGFQELTRSCPRFADPWIWLSATVDDSIERITCLNKAGLLEPAHPLALDALDIAQGKVSPTAVRREPVSVVVVRCSQCGGRLDYEPGTETVQCRHCGHEIRLRGADPLGWRALSITTLRLMRRYQDKAWDEVEHILHCQTCGAELTTSRHLAQKCAYCGSTNALVEDDPRILQQPDSLFPFEMDEKRATDAVRRAGHTDLEIEVLRGLYVPFWSFDGVVEVRWLQTYKDQVLDSVREDKLVYNNMFFPAVDVPPPSLLDEIPPFHLYRLVSYQAHFLADWSAQLPSLDVEAVAEDACDAMLALAHRQSGLPVKAQVSWDRDKDRPTPSQASRSFQVSGVTYQLVLVPLWVVSLRSGKRHSLALVNGQTGKVVLGSWVIPESSD